MCLRVGAPSRHTPGGGSGPKGTHFWHFKAKKGQKKFSRPCGAGGVPYRPPGGPPPGGGHLGAHPGGGSKNSPFGGVPQPPPPPPPRGGVGQPLKRRLVP